MLGPMGGSVSGKRNEWSVFCLCLTHWKMEMDALRFSSLAFESIGFLLIIMSREVAPVVEEGEKELFTKAKRVCMRRRKL